MKPARGGVGSLGLFFPEASCAKDRPRQPAEQQSLGPGPVLSHTASVPFSSTSLDLSGSVSTVEEAGQSEGPQEQREGAEERGAPWNGQVLVGRGSRGPGGSSLAGSGCG